jgi:hypothetical protein
MASRGKIISTRSSARVTAAEFISGAEMTSGVGSGESAFRLTAQSPGGTRGVHAIASEGGFMSASFRFERAVARRRGLNGEEEMRGERSGPAAAARRKRIAFHFLRVLLAELLSIQLPVAESGSYIS